MKENHIALTIGGETITTPSDVPTGGLTKAVGIGSNIIALIFTAAIIFALFILIFGGIRWITSGGDKNKVDSARKTIMYAIIGLILIFLSFFIINTITGFFGISGPAFSIN